MSLFEKSLIVALVLLLCSCGPKRKSEGGYFSGYQSTFKDRQNKHLASAKCYGIVPCNREDDIKKKRRKLEEVETCSNYKVDKLTHSYPYLVPKAFDLLDKIGENFRDSLRVNGFPKRRIIVTSVLRTKEKCAQLAGVNINASPNSTHLYGTTFDIAYGRYDGKRGDVTEQRLKSTLAQVLNDLRNNKECYVLYEIKQSCFHITVR